MKNPCYKCEIREKSCWSKCESYKSFREEISAQVEKRIKEAVALDFVIRSTVRENRKRGEKIMLEHPDITSALRTGYPRQWDNAEEEINVTAEQVMEFIFYKLDNNDFVRTFFDFLKESCGMKFKFDDVLVDFADSIGKDKIIEELNL